MAVEEINAKGGVLGQQVKPVVVDPAQTGICLPKKPSSSLAGQGCGGIRLLDIGQPQVCPASL